MDTEKNIKLLLYDNEHLNAITSRSSVFADQFWFSVDVPTNKCTYHQILNCGSFTGWILSFKVLFTMYFFIVDGIFAIFFQRSKYNWWQGLKLLPVMNSLNNLANKSTYK